MHLIVRFMVEGQAEEGSLTFGLQGLGLQRIKLG